MHLLNKVDRNERNKFAENNERKRNREAMDEMARWHNHARDGGLGVDGDQNLIPLATIKGTINNPLTRRNLLNAHNIYDGPSMNARQFDDKESFIGGFLAREQEKHATSKPFSHNEAISMPPINQLQIQKDRIEQVQGFKNLPVPSGSV